MVCVDTERLEIYRSGEDHFLEELYIRDLHSPCWCAAWSMETNPMPAYGLNYKSRNGEFTFDKGFTILLHEFLGANLR